MGAHARAHDTPTQHRPGTTDTHGRTRNMQNARGHRPICFASRAAESHSCAHPIGSAARPSTAPLCCLARRRSSAVVQGKAGVGAGVGAGAGHGYPSLRQATPKIRACNGSRVFRSCCVVCSGRRVLHVATAGLLLRCSAATDRARPCLPVIARGLIGAPLIRLRFQVSAGRTHS